MAQETPILRFATRIGSTGNDSGNAVTLTSTGDILVTGYFQGTVDFDPSASFNNLTAANEDIFIVKYDATGSFLWAKSFKGSSTARGMSITTDNSGNILITGEFQGTIDFDPGAPAFNLTSAGGRDIFITKLDATGNFIWAKRIGFTLDDYGYGVKADASGNIYVAGMFRRVVDFDPGTAIFYLTPVGVVDDGDQFILKLDAGGNFVWAKNFGGAIDDYALGLTVDLAGSVLVIGKIYGGGDLDPGPGVNSPPGFGKDDVTIVKFNSAGNFVWGAMMGGLEYDQGYGITTDATGNVYSTGYFSGTADFDPGPGTFNLVAEAAYTEVFISKLDVNGNFVWAKRLGGPALATGLETFGRSIALDAAGNVYTTGDFDYTMDFDPGSGVFNMTAAAPTGRTDIFVSKLDNSGNFVWAYRLGGGQNDQGHGLAVSSGGDVFTTGYFLTTADLDPGICAANFISQGGTDMYIERVSTIPNPTPPTITSFTPGGGAVGASVTITGTNFSTTPLNNVVKFGSAFATVISSTSTTITTTVPTGATSGFITVRIGCITASSSPGNFFVSTNTVPSYIPATGLVAYYGFPGLALDATANHNDGTLFGPTSVNDRHSSSNKAYSFDGVNDYIKVNDSPSLRVTDVTISGWFKFNSTTGLQLMVDKHFGSSNFDSYELWYDAGKIWGVIGDVSGLATPVSASFTPVAGDWYNIAYTFNDATNTQSLYIEGCLVAQNTTTTQSIAYDSEPLLIGASNDFTTPQLFFNGTIDDVAIWNRELSISEVRDVISGYLSSEGFDPVSGPVGTVVQFSAEGYSLLATNNTITFNGVSATVNSVSPTLTATVPAGAVTGPVILQRGCMSVDNGTFTVTGSSCIPAAEHDALIAIYDALNGDAWNNNTNWKNGGDESTWHGVLIAGCRVTGLNLQNNALSGQLPSEIGDLTELIELNVSQNDVNGVIPSGIGFLTKVKNLYLYQNALSGQIPAEVGDMTELRIFDVSNNQLDGDLPPSMAALPHITEVHIHFNYFVNIPVMPPLAAYITNNNALTFEDIEPNIPVGHYDFEYDSQTEVPPGGNIYLSPGDALNIPFTTGGTANVYQWYKDGGPISGQTSNNLSIASVSLADGGTYQLVITNTIAPDLTLGSSIYYVDVTDQCGPRVDGLLDATFDAKVDYASGFQAMELQSDGKIITYLPYASINGSMYPYNGVYRFNTDGSMDGSFNPSGETPGFHQLIVQNDDKFIVGAFETINRYNADGSPDPAFAGPIYPASSVNALASQNDRKVLFSTYDSDIGENVIVRVNTDGSVDPSFNAPVAYPAAVIVVQADGKILVGGYFDGGIVRLDASGTIDPGFNVGSGIAAGSGNVQDIAIQADGKILVAGYFSTFNGIFRENIIRLNTDGSVDVTFDAGAAGSSDDYLQVVKVMGNGKVIVGGAFSQFGGRGRTNLARLNADGSLDCSFTLGMGIDGALYDIEIQADQKILIQGSFSTYDGATPNGFARITNSSSSGPTVTITVQPTDVTACGEDLVSFSTNATGTSNITYQWQHSPNSSPLNFTDISNGLVYSGVATSVLNISGPGVSEVGRYRCRINGDGAAEVITIDRELIALPPPPDPGVSGNTGCQSTTVVLTASGASNGQYRWYTAPTGGTPIAGQVNSTFTTPALAITTTYYVAINIGTCESARFAIVATINPLPAAPIATPGTACAPSAAVALSASGGTNGQYRWYTTPTGGSPIAGVTGNIFTTPAITTSTSYYVSINNGLCESGRTVVLAEIRSCTPKITTSALSTQIGGQVTLDIAPLVATILNPIDVNSIKVIKQPLSGALAKVNAGVLSVNYTGISFAGRDQLTLEACDMAAHCASEDFTIDVAGNITVYNALSPNGDGKNEAFYIQYIELLPDTKRNKVSVFDRWGNVVFEVDDYDNTTRVFRGLNSNGNELPNGVYFYELILLSSGEKRSGFLSLRR